MICADGFKRCYYPIFAGVMLDYKEQIHITRIKTNMQCSICHIIKEPDKIVGNTNIQIYMVTA